MPKSTIPRGLLLIAVGSMAVAMATGCSSGSEVDLTAYDAEASKDRHLNALNGFADCMGDRGWEVVVVDDYVTYPTVEDQREQQASDAEDCSSEWLQVNYAEMTERDWDGAYAASVQTAQCLIDLGYAISIPSRQSFVDSQAGWSPYNDIIDSGQAADAYTVTLEQSCPQPAYWPE